MPRKLIQDSYRGWYGWEDKFNSMLRMSNTAMTQTNQRNERIRFEHGEKMGLLSQAETRTNRKSAIEIRRTRTDLIEMLAYKKAYEALSFSRRSPISPWGKQTPERPKTIDVNVTSQVHTLGDRNLISSPIEEKQSVDIDNTNELATSTSEDKVPAPYQVGNKVTINFPSVPINSKGKPNVEKKISNNDTNCCENTENIAIEELNGDSAICNSNEENNNRGNANEDNYQVLYGTIREIGEATEMHRLTKKDTSLNRPHTVKGKSRVLNGQCRSMFAIRRLTDSTAEQIIEAWSPENLRREKVRKLLQGVQFPELINRERSTSAIFRGFAQYKEYTNIEQEKHLKLKTRRPVMFQELKKPIPRHAGYNRSKTVN